MYVAREFNEKYHQSGAKIHSVLEIWVIAVDSYNSKKSNRAHLFWRFFNLIVIQSLATVFEFRFDFAKIQNANIEETLIRLMKKPRIIQTYLNRKSRGQISCMRTSCWQKTWQIPPPDCYWIGAPSITTIFVRWREKHLKKHFKI